MVRNKRLLVVCLLLIFALCLACIAACTDKEEGFSVTVAPYDATQGTVEVSDPAEGELYDQGETVTITVTPKDGFEVTSFVVNHDDVQSIGSAGGTHRFRISADVTVTVTFDVVPDNHVTLATGTVGEGASVTFDPQPIDGKVEKGTPVTVTVTVEQGYILQAVKRNGVKEELTNNSFGFVAQENTTIDVETQAATAEQALNALKGAVKFEGTLVEEDEGYDPIYSTIVNVFDPQRNAVWLREVLDDGSTYSDEVIGKNDDGNAIRYSHNYLDGKVVASVLYYENGSPIAYDYFANACDALVAADLTSADNITWTFVNTAIAKAVANSVTGYDFDVETFTITLNDGKVTLNIVSQPILMEDDYGEYNVELTFELTASHDGTVIPQERFEDYPDVPELSAALRKAAAQDSYTATYTQTDLPGEYTQAGETTYVSYRTSNAVWMDNPDDLCGYVVRPDGKVWEFFLYKDGGMWLGDDPFANNLGEISCAFDLGGISPNMFTLDEDGNYVLRDADVVYYSDREVYLTAIAAQSFTIGQGDMFNDASRAVNFAITLQDGAIHSVSYHGEYWYYDMLFDNFDAEIVFDHFGETQLPDDVTLDSELVDGTIDPNYVGVWVNDDKSVRIDISLDGIIVNYAGPDEITLIPDGGYKLTFIDGEITIALNGDKLVVKGMGEGEMQLRRQLCEWEDILGTFSTVLFDENGVPTKISVEITLDSLTVTIGDISEVYKDFLWDYGQFMFDDYSTIYQLDLDGNVIKYNFYVSYLPYSFPLYREGMEVDLTDYVGTYTTDDPEYSGTRVVIKEDGISVWLTGVTGENVASDIVVSHYLDDDTQEEFVQITFVVEGGWVFHIQPLSKDKIFLFDEMEDFFPEAALLVSDTYVEDYSAFCGEYTGIGGNQITIKIEQGKITITLGRNAPPTVIEQFDFYDVEYGTPCFVWEDEQGIIYTIEQYGLDLGYINYYGFDPDNREITFDNYLEKNDHVVDLGNIVGTYFGNDGTDSYKVEITEREFKLYKNDALQTITVLMYVSQKVYGEIVYDFSFQWNGNYYHVQPVGMLDGKVVQLAFGVETEEGIRQLFVCNMDLTKDETDMSVYAGTYEGEGFKAVITDTTLTFYVDGQQTELTDMRFVSYFDFDVEETFYKYTFSIGGVTYEMQSADDKNCMLLTSNDGKVYVLISSEYSHVAEYYGYNGYFESEDGKYAIEITDDTVDISVDGAKQQTAVVYFGYEAGLVVTFGGKTYHIGVGYSEERDSRYLLLLDNDAVKVTLFAIGKPIDDWTNYYGRYEGMAEGKEYAAEIGDGVFNITIKGETIAAENIILRHDSEEDIDIFYFTLNGEPYRLRMENDGEARVVSADGEINCWLEIVRESDAWKQFFGIWEGKDGQTTYRIEISADEKKLFVDGEEQTATFKFDSGNRFDVTWAGSYMTLGLVYHSDENGEYLNFSGMTPTGDFVDVDLYPVQECAWADAVGTYNGDETNSVVIREDSIEVSIGDLHFTVYAEDIEYSYRTPEDEDPYHRFFFTVNGSDYVIEVYSDLNFLTIEDDGELYESLNRPTACAWAEYFGTWSYIEGSDVYEIVISADGFDVTCLDDVYTVSADDITFNFDPETGFTWTHDGVHYNLEINDDHFDFFDDGYNLLAGYGLYRAE